MKLFYHVFYRHLRNNKGDENTSKMIWIVTIFVCSSIVFGVVATGFSSKISPWYENVVGSWFDEDIGTYDADGDGEADGGSGGGSGEAEGGGSGGSGGGSGEEGGGGSGGGTTPTIPSPTPLGYQVEDTDYVYTYGMRFIGGPTVAATVGDSATNWEMSGTDTWGTRTKTLIVTDDSFATITLEADDEIATDITTYEGIQYEDDSYVYTYGMTYTAPTIAATLGDYANWEESGVAEWGKAPKTVIAVGTERQDEHFTYKYGMEYSAANTWVENGTNGWGVRVTDNTLASYPAIANEFEGIPITSTVLTFYDCDCTSIDLTGFDSSHVINMYGMFGSCFDLVSLNLGNDFDTSNVTNMCYMFGDCCDLISLDLGDKFDTSNVTNMLEMFYQCTRLTSLDLGDNFDTSNVTTMSEMFYWCKALVSLDLGDEFNTANATDIGYMFEHCESLTSLNLGDKFDTSSVTKMNSMFNNCGFITLTSLDLGDLFVIGTSTTTNSMFYNAFATGATITVGSQTTRNKIASLWTRGTVVVG